jgi:hypothetical protein
MGYEPGVIDEKWRCFYLTQSGVFAISKPINGEPASHGNGSTIGFSVKTSDIADAWFAAGIANGGSSCEDAPDMREGLIGKLYLAYLRDPSNNKVCALHRVVLFRFVTHFSQLKFAPSMGVRYIRRDAT